MKYNNVVSYQYQYISHSDINYYEFMLNVFAKNIDNIDALEPFEMFEPFEPFLPFKPFEPFEPLEPFETFGLLEPFKLFCSFDCNELR
jgi:hypothetical protein